VRANFVTSLDGAVELDGRSGPLGGPEDRAVFGAYRAVCDVVLVGAATVVAENYGPLKADGDLAKRRLSRGQPSPARLAVVGGADLSSEARIFESDPPPLLIATRQLLERRPDLGSRAEIVLVEGPRADLAQALAELRARGLARVLCEGGPSLLAGLVSRDLLDELCLTLSPLLVGSGRRSLLGSLALPKGIELGLVWMASAGSTLFTRYRLGAKGIG